MVSKAQHFMLSNDLMPPDYHHSSKMNERIEQAALTTANDSVANALKEESARTRGETMYPDGATLGGITVPTTTLFLVRFFPSANTVFFD